MLPLKSTLFLSLITTTLAIPASHVNHDVHRRLAPSATATSISIPTSEVTRMQQILDLQRVPAAQIGGDSLVPYQGFSAGQTISFQNQSKNALRNLDWFGFQAKLNCFDQYVTTIENTKIHFIHQKSSAPNAIPLLLIHGWGSTISEYMNVITPLITPGSATNVTGVSFNVVVVSLPGTGLSQLVQANASTPHDVARIFDTLMTGVLGYSHYVAQGGDFGAIYLRQLQVYYAKTCVLAMFQGFPAAQPNNSIPTTQLPIYEQRLLKYVAQFSATGLGYLIEHETKPSTIGLTLQDSPLSALAWLGEKYMMIGGWSNLTAAGNQTLWDDLVQVIAYYQLTRSTGTALVQYHLAQDTFIFDAFYTNPAGQAPFALQHFEGEFFLSPSSWVAQAGPLIWKTYHPFGGHFAALVNPADFVADCRTFFGTYYANQVVAVS